MRDDFCAFILTHGRPDKVLTYRTLRRAGYRQCYSAVVSMRISTVITNSHTGIQPAG